MGQALYRKYRSKSLSEVVGQAHITDTLEHALQTGRISHAYLFTGPRGVGKTSVARILAHQLNDVPYTEEDNHLDIIEIDAASNRGIDEIRDLREKVYVAPTSGKYKVYIIDEVHMLTTPAFNALLKTLEEPPAHVIFILATTEVHKLPETIISRTQRFTFKPVARPDVMAHLRHIATEEKIDITDEALELVAAHGQGSFRDSIGLLDQAGGLHDRIDQDAIERLIGIPPDALVAELLAASAAGQAAPLLEALAIIRTQGFQAAAVAKAISETLRNQLIAGELAGHEPAVLHLLQQLLEIPVSHSPDHLLELILLEATLAQASADTPPPAQPQPVTTTSPPATSIAHEKPTDQPSAAEPATKKPAVPPKKSTEPKPKPKQAEAKTEPATAVAPTASDTMLDEASWNQALQALKKQYNTLYSVIRMAHPRFSAGAVELTFGFAFHQKRANDAKNKALLAAVLEKLTGQDITITCLFDKDTVVAAPTPAKPAAAPATDAPLSAISNIFGGGELLQS